MVEHEEQNQIVASRSRAFFDHYRWNAPESEVRSWRNTLRALANALELGGFDDHGLLLEFQLPLTSRRLDAMITGHDRSGRPGSVIVELKQWSDDVQPSKVEDMVTVRYGKRLKQTLHPSAQVGQYRQYLADSHETFHDGGRTCCSTSSRWCSRRSSPRSPRPTLATAVCCDHRPVRPAAGDVLRRFDMTLVLRRLVAAFALTSEIAASLDAPGLNARNGAARSNTIGGQLWCVVGARESYTRAIESGSWVGFSCSLTEPHSPDAVRASLSQSAQLLIELVEARDQLTEAQEDFLLDVLEHEVQHHGQLIRFFFANDVAFPAGFASRYALS